MKDFRPQAPSAGVVFLRTYSRRKADGKRENFEEAMLRTVNDIARIGKYTQEEYAMVRDQALKQRHQVLCRELLPTNHSVYITFSDQKTMY